MKFPDLSFETGLSSEIAILTTPFRKNEKLPDLSFETGLSSEITILTKTLRTYTDDA